MKINTSRFKPAFKAMSVHFGLSLLVAAIVALLVFTLWFPYPYRELAGGRELFILVMAVDIVCGPILTFVLFSPTKPRKELITDISLIAVIQILALCYGIWTVWQIRPLYLVQVADKLTIISRANIDTEHANSIRPELRTSWLDGPVKVSLQQLSAQEIETINSDIKAGGSDAAERPNLYIRFDGQTAFKNGHPLKNLLITHPTKKDSVTALVNASTNKDIEQLRYLYIVGRHYWLAVLNSKGNIVGYIYPD